MLATLMHRYYSANDKLREMLEQELFLLRRYDLNTLQQQTMEREENFRNYQEAGQALIDWQIHHPEEPIAAGALEEVYETAQTIHCRLAFYQQKLDQAIIVQKKLADTFIKTYKARVPKSSYNASGQTKDQTSSLTQYQV